MNTLRLQAETSILGGFWPIPVDAGETKAKALKGDYEDEGNGATPEMDAKQRENLDSILRSIRKDRAGELRSNTRWAVGLLAYGTVGSIGGSLAQGTALEQSGVFAGYLVTAIFAVVLGLSRVSHLMNSSSNLEKALSNAEVLDAANRRLDSPGSCTKAQLDDIRLFAFEGWELPGDTANLSFNDATKVVHALKKARIDGIGNQK